nr:hypothetical protein [Clostridia bacterium]
MTIFVVIYAVITSIGSAMPQNSFSASVHFDSDAPAAGLLNPDSEVRGVWIASVENINYPSKPGLDADA